MTSASSIPKTNPSVILREEFSEYALLFDPETGKGFGLTEVGTAIWKLIDGHHTLSTIAGRLKELFDNVPPLVEADVVSFVNELITEGLASDGDA